MAKLTFVAHRQVQMAMLRLWRHRIRHSRQCIRAAVTILLLFVMVQLISLSFRSQTVNDCSELHDDGRVEVVMPERCSRPQVDPHHQLFSRFDQNVSLICPIDEVVMTSINPVTGNISLNLKAIENLRINCTYSLIMTRMGNDNQIVSTKPLMFPDNGTIFLSASNNTAAVSCTDGIGDKIYSNTHLFVPRFPSVTRASPAKPNVLVILLSSLSQLMFHRQMKSTRSEMKGMRFQDLDYFVTLRDDPLINRMALFTGHSLSSSFAKSSRNYYYDKVKQFKFVWEAFKKQNYTTGLMSDMGTAGLFHPSAKGFYKQPTDFYPHAFWNQVTPAVQRDPKHRTQLRDYCFGMNGHKVKIFLDQVLDFVDKNRNNPYFLIASYNQMTRFNSSHFKLADPFFAAFFKKLKLLTLNTIVLFAGDYGLQGNPYVATSIGRLEERMSLFSIRVPDSIDQHYPHLRRLLTRNRERLLSWMDIHVMVKDIADQSFHTVNINRRKTMGINPMRQEIPADRSCDNAVIRDEYCVCGNHVYLDLHTKSVDIDIRLLNEALKNYLNHHCGSSVSFKLKFVYYDVSPQILSAGDAATVCFVVGDSRKRFFLNLTRHWNEEIYGYFNISRNLQSNFDNSMCKIK